MERVLLINDCKFESIIMKDMLEDLGYDVEISDEASVMTNVKDFLPDIVIVNLILKQTTGDEIIKRIKVFKPEIVCLLSTSNNVKLNDFKGVIIDNIIHTPISKEKLKDTINLSEYANKDLTKSNNRYKTLEHKEENRIKLLFCPYCGNKIGDKQFKFCPYCGQSMEL